MVMHERIQALEEPDSGLLRTTIGWDQKDPQVSYVLVVFESEEKARAREQNPHRRTWLRSDGVLRPWALRPFAPPLEVVEVVMRALLRSRPLVDPTVGSRPVPGLRP